LTKKTGFLSNLGTPTFIDLKSGITVGVIIIPQAMAYATLAGLPAQHGLYAAFIPVLLYGLFGSSRYLSVGPAALDSMLVAAFLLSLKLTTLADYIQSAILLTFMVGIIQFLLGILKMGFIIQFFSKPVISGFTNAAVLLIGASQLAPLLGLASLRMPAEQLSNSFGVIAITTAIGISALLALALAKRYAPKIPIALLVVLLATVASAYFNWNEIGVREIGRIPSGLPSLSLHVFDVLLIRDLLPFAAALAILGFLSSMTIIKASESKTSVVESNPNKELRALGLANITGSFFQSYVASASFSRSAILLGGSVRSRWASIFSALLVGISLFVLTPFFTHMPIAVLAAIVIFSLLKLLSLQYPKTLWKQSKAEFLIFMTTFILTLSVGIIEGLVLGILSSLVVWVAHSVHPHYAILGQIKNTQYYKNVKRFSEDIEEEASLLLFRFDAPVFFANKDYFNKTIMEEVNKKGPELKEVVLISRAISYLDSSSVELLHHILDQLSKKGVGFSVAGAIGPTRDAMKRAGLMDRIGVDRFFAKTADAVAYLNGTSATTEHTESIATQTNQLNS
tara:strand:+ start:143 stop:1843 length:1701 start_codon:yes stop_codon:yes gene_type:complete